MPKIKGNKIMDSGGVITAGESHISDDHWGKIIGKGKETGITGNVYLYSNPGLLLGLSDLPHTINNNLQTNSTLLYGDLSQAPACNGLIISSCTAITGNLATLPVINTYLYLDGITNITGALADLYATLQFVRLFGCTGITPASIAHLVAARDLRIYSMWAALTAAESVDIVIDSMWTARALYTYATPSMQIGGTNKSPTGNYIAPIEGADWHEDAPGHWVPLTPKAKIYDLMNDVNTEGFNVWTITYTA